MKTSYSKSHLLMIRFVKMCIFCFSNLPCFHALEKITDKNFLHDGCVIGRVVDCKNLTQEETIFLGHDPSRKKPELITTTLYNSEFIIRLLTRKAEKLLS